MLMIAFFIAKAAIAQPDANADDSLRNGAEMLNRNLRIEFEDEKIAERAGSKITLSDIHGRMLLIPEERRLEFLSDVERMTQLINQVLFARWLADHAKTEGLLSDPDVQSAILWRAAEILAQAARRDVIQSIGDRDYMARAKELYLANRDEFRTPARVTFTHLLVASDGDWESARGEAERFMARVEAGTDLSSLAREYSDDPSAASNDGKLSDVVKEALDPVLGEAVFDMEPGELDLVRSSRGWHLVQLVEKQARRQQTFEEVETQLLTRARREHRNEVLERFVARFYDSPLELTDGAVERIFSKYESER